MTTYALLHTIFFFFVYAFLGWCVEVAYAAITTRELVNRGFLNGPICPIYGCGMTVMIAVLGRFTMPSSDMAWYQNVLVAFFGGMVITTLVELVGGYILYKMFHTRWWDYSMYRFNLGGFICPQFSLLWGLGSVLLMVVVHPLLSKPSAAIPTLVLIWLDVIFGGLFLADLIVSAIQAVGFSKQLARIDELRKAMRTKKMSAMDATLIKFSTADSCPTIIWRAMAYSSTSSALPGLCLASILMNSMPMTISSARCKNRLISTSLVSTSRPGSILISGTTASINATTTSSEMPTSSRPANSASWSRKMRFTRSSPLCSTVREKWGCLLFVFMFLLPWGVS